MACQCVNSCDPERYVRPPTTIYYKKKAKKKYKDQKEKAPQQKTQMQGLQLLAAGARYHVLVLRIGCALGSTCPVRHTTPRPLPHNCTYFLAIHGHSSSQYPSEAIKSLLPARGTISSVDTRCPRF